MKTILRALRLALPILVAFTLTPGVWSTAVSADEKPGRCVIKPNQKAQAESLGIGVITNAKSVCDASIEGCGACIELCRLFTNIKDDFGCPLDGADGFCNPDFEATDPDCCARNGQCNAACGTGSAPIDPDCIWPRTPSQTAISIGALDFININEGWVVGDNGRIVHTTDGGATFTFQNAGVGTLDLTAVNFVNSTHGWVGVQDLVGKFQIIHTADGGATWSQQLAGLKGGVRSFFFLDVNTGWANAGSRILKTTDGGATWTQQSSGGFRGGIHFVDPLNGWTPTFRTMDGGITWMAMPASPVGATSGVDFVDLQNGWRVGRDGIERTTDGGLSWTVVLTGNFHFNAVDFVDTVHGRVAGSRGGLSEIGGILRTSDGGNTWTRQTRSENYVDIQMFDADNGYAMGFETGPFVGIPLFVRSTTGGN